jgi:RNA polymerase sigma-70 factor (ECF subfamily)
MISFSNEPATDQAAAPTVRADFLVVIPYVRALARCLCSDDAEATTLARESVSVSLSSRKTRVATVSLLNWCFANELRVLHDRTHGALADRKRTTLRPSFLDSLKRTFGAPAAHLHLSEALSTLPNEEREAVVLVDGARRTASEAAEICRCTTSELSRRLNRGRRKLDRMLAVDDVA